MIEVDSNEMDCFYADNCAVVPSAFSLYVQITCLRVPCKPDPTLASPLPYAFVEYRNFPSDVILLPISASATVEDPIVKGINEFTTHSISILERGTYKKSCILS